MHVGEAHIASTESPCQSSVIDAEEMQHRCVEVVHRDWFVHGFVTVLISCAVNQAFLHTAASEEDGVSEWIVIAAVASLREGRSSEFASPHDERGFEKSEALEIEEKRRGRLIDRARVVFVTLAKISVLIPTIVRCAWNSKFHKSNAALDEPARE